MTTTTLTIDHDKLETLLDDGSEFASLLYFAVTGDTDAAEQLEREHGIAVVAQKPAAADERPRAEL